MKSRSIIWLIFALTICPLSHVLLPRARAEDEQNYAVIAYSASTRNWVAISRVRNLIDGEQSAMNLCNNQPAERGYVKVLDDSRIAGWVANGWCALALSKVDRNHYTFGWADTPARAMELALWESENRARDCYIAVVVHSGIPQVKTSRDQ